MCARSDSAAPTGICAQQTPPTPPSPRSPTAAVHPPRPVRRRAQEEVWQHTGAGPARCAPTTKREPLATQRGFTRRRWNCADTLPSLATMERQDQRGKSSPVTAVNGKAPWSHHDPYTDEALLDPWPGYKQLRVPAPPCGYRSMRCSPSPGTPRSGGRWRIGSPSRLATG